MPVSVTRDSAVPPAAGLWPLAWRSACILFAVGAACSRSVEPGRPPNVVVILVDDLRWDDIGIAGHPFAQTPAIDRLAREGTRFLNAFATTPLCSPSRAAILTVDGPGGFLGSLVRQFHAQTLLCSRRARSRGGAGLV